MTTTDIDALVAWLQALKEKGGKGVVGNIDARALGRIADALEHQQADLEALAVAAQKFQGNWRQDKDDSLELFNLRKALALPSVVAVLDQATSRAAATSGR